MSEFSGGGAASTTRTRYLRGPEGPEGPQGETGLTGAAGDGGFSYVQSTPVLSEVINHNLGRRCTVDIYTIGGVKLGCEVQHLNLNQVQVTFITLQAYIATIV